ncbi:MAG: hypothetical protein MUO21_11780 [Nitrososphaeraceae archaeon]|nr:hypothetical protein [Nitrososphaeraceae archaeon]
MGWCCGPIPNESCGWPRGTITGTLAIIIITITMLTGTSAVIILITIYNQHTVAVGILGTMFVVVSAVTTHYFDKQANKAIVDAKNSEIDRLAETNTRIINRELVRSNRSRKIRSIKKKKKNNADLLEVDEHELSAPVPVIVVE